jgi:hypothetical protein
LKADNYSAVLAEAARARTGSDCASPATSLFKNRIDGATVATTIVHGTTGELQKIVVLKLSKASQIKVTNVPNSIAFRLGPLRNGCE